MALSDTQRQALDTCFQQHAPSGGWMSVQGFADHLHAGGGVQSTTTTDAIGREIVTVTGTTPCPTIGAAFQDMAVLDGATIQATFGLPN